MACDCPRDDLCIECYTVEVKTLRPLAGIIGAAWAKRVSRFYPVPSLTVVKKLAATRVDFLTQDERVREELVAACLAGAAAWWDDWVTGAV